MSYETHFRLKSELDKEFKTWMKESDKIDEQMYKNLLIASCMKMRGDDVDHLKTYKDVKWNLDIYVNYLIESWKLCLQKELEENNNETWFCGWQHAQDNNTWQDEDEIKNYFLKNLFLLAIINVPSPFIRDERSEYNEKLTQVTDLIDDIDECVIDMMDRKFINRYRDSDDAWESDGYNHRFPEEKDEDEESENEESEDKEEIDE